MQLKANFILFLLSSILCLYSSYKVFNSYVLQYNLVEEYNKQTFNSNTAQKIFRENLTYPNISVTTIPLVAIKANYLIIEEKFDEALQVLNAPIKDNPNLFFKESLKAKIFRALQIKDSAEFYSKKAYYGLPRNPVHFENIAIIHGANSDIDSLVSAFNYVEHTNPQIFQMFFATLLNIDKPYPDSVKEIANKSLSLFPRDEGVITLAKYILYGRVNVDQSVIISKQAQKEFNSKNFEESLKLYLKCIELNPGDSSFFENVGLIYYELKDFESAIKYLSLSIDMPRTVEGKTEYLLGLSYAETQNFELACKYLTKSRKANFKLAFNALNKYCK